MLDFAVVVYSTLALVAWTVRQSPWLKAPVNYPHLWTNPCKSSQSYKTGQKYVHHKLSLFPNNRALLHSIVTAILGIQGPQTQPAISCYVLIQSNMGSGN